MAAGSQKHQGPQTSSLHRWVQDAAAPMLLFMTLSKNILKILDLKPPPPQNRQCHLRVTLKLHHPVNTCKDFLATTGMR